MRRCLLCFFSSIAACDWFIPVAMVPCDQRAIDVVPFATKQASWAHPRPYSADSPQPPSAISSYFPHLPPLPPSPLSTISVASARPYNLILHAELASPASPGSHNCRIILPRKCIYRKPHIPLNKPLPRGRRHPWAKEGQTAWRVESLRRNKPAVAACPQIVIPTDDLI
jgi:hypothetical protein